MSDWEKLQEISKIMSQMNEELETCKKLLNNIEGKLIKVIQC